MVKSLRDTRYSLGSHGRSRDGNQLMGVWVTLNGRTRLAPGLERSSRSRHGHLIVSRFCLSSLLVRLFSPSDFNVIGPATMLIDSDFDFDWDEDRGESPRRAKERAAANVPGASTAPCLAGGSTAPVPEIVIVERCRGFSYGTLALAILALIVSATARLSNPRRPNAGPIHRPAIEPEHRPHEQADPDGRRTGGTDRTIEAAHRNPVWSD